MSQTFKPILGYPNKVLSQLCLQINQQLTVLKKIKAILPIELAQHVSHCVISNEKLLVYTDSSNWASQLRFYGNEMLVTAQSFTKTSVSVVQIKVISLPDSKLTNSGSLHHKTANTINNHSLKTPDQALKEALTKLSTTLERLRSM